MHILTVHVRALVQEKDDYIHVSSQRRPMERYDFLICRFTSSVTIMFSRPYEAYGGGNTLNMLDMALDGGITHG